MHNEPLKMFQHLINVIETRKIKPMIRYRPRGRTGMPRYMFLLDLQLDKRLSGLIRDYGMDNTEVIEYVMAQILFYGGPYFNSVGPGLEKGWWDDINKWAKSYLEELPKADWAKGFDGVKGPYSIQMGFQEGIDGLKEELAELGDREVIESEPRGFINPSIGERLLKNLFKL